MGRREIDPVRPFAGLAFARDFEMHGGRSCVGPRKSVGTEPIAGCRLLLVDREHRFEMASRLVGQARATGPRCFGQMLRMLSTDMLRIDAEQSKSVKRDGRN